MYVCVRARPCVRAHAQPLVFAFGIHDVSTVCCQFAFQIASNESRSATLTDSTLMRRGVSGMHAMSKCALMRPLPANDFLGKSLLSNDWLRLFRPPVMPRNACAEGKSNSSMFPFYFRGFVFIQKCCIACLQFFVFFVLLFFCEWGKLLRIFFSCSFDVSWWLFKNGHNF